MNLSLTYCYISQTKMACDVCRNLNCPGVESDVAQSFLIVSLPRCYESCLVSYLYSAVSNHTYSFGANYTAHACFYFIGLDVIRSSIVLYRFN